jgi:hypothetical protein
MLYMMKRNVSNATPSQPPAQAAITYMTRPY